ncbi:hypothetical protein [Pelagibius sp.]|uniref:phosphorylase family protein n=1 Tax=Pelagibius sp. TaxID=1931238 RepID=UPI0026096BD5|nr:hypothetical protein [Pelagibius sp.]
MVTGIAAEAALVERLAKSSGIAVRVVCSGARASEAQRLAQGLLAEGVEALLSFGIAGGLSPDLNCGDLVVAGSVRLEDGTRHDCHPPWRDVLNERIDGAGLPFRQGSILGHHRALRQPDEKAAAFAASGCLAVDMESQGVAAVAAAHGRPFLALRAISDTQADSLPPLIETAVRPDGEPAVARVLAALAKRPQDLPALFRMRRQSRLALSRLESLEAESAVLFGGL